MILLDFRNDAREPAGSGPPLRIDIRGDIDVAMLACVASDLADHPDAHAIVIDIDSHGGDFAAGFDMYVNLRRHPANRKVARILRAESAALLVAMAADERIAEPGAPILLHCVATPPGCRWTASRHVEAADFLRWADANLAAIFAYRTSRPSDVFTKAMADEEPAPLDWCLRHNIITGIR